MSIHRTIDGSRRIAAWGEAGLDRWPPHHRSIVDSPLGPTHPTSAGAGPRNLVRLPGTNFDAAAHADLAHRLVTDGRFRVDEAILLGPAGPAKLRITLELLPVTIPWMVRPTRDRAARQLIALLAPRMEQG